MKNTNVPDEAEVYRQSKAAFKQWDADWTKNCELNKPYYKNSLQEVMGEGEGKSIFAVAYGSSLQDKFEQLKSLQDLIPIICVEKAFKALVEHEIFPKYVVVADANVNYEKYGKDVDSSKTSLIINICGNHEWVKNWKGKIYFYLNIDNIGTQYRYGKLTGVKEFIPASSNVGNAVVVLTQMILKYTQVMLIGYDYSWQSQNQYYGNEDHADKRFYMNHMKLVDINDNIVSTSGNLDFSCRWLLTYIARYRMNAINLSGQGLLDPRLMGIPASPYFRHGDINTLVSGLVEQINTNKEVKVS